MRGFEFLDTYKKTFDASEKSEFNTSRKPVASPVQEVVDGKEEESETENQDFHNEDKIPTIEKIKGYLSRMFEVEDQPIK